MTYFPLHQTTCFFIPLVAPCKPLLLFALYTDWEKGKQENGAHSKGILWRGVLCVSSASAGSARADSYRSFDRLLPSCCFGSSTCAAVLGNQRSCLYYM